MQTEEGRKKAQETRIKNAGGYRAYIKQMKAQARKGGTSPHLKPWGFGSKQPNKNGLTGSQQAKVAARKRWNDDQSRKSLESSEDSMVQEQPSES